MDRSLVRWTAEAGGSRFSLFRTIWVFARERLLASPEAPQIRQRHTQLFAETVTPFLDELLDVLTCVVTLEPELDNLLAAAEDLQNPVDAAKCAVGAGNVLQIDGPIRRGFTALLVHQHQPPPIGIAIHIKLSRFYRFMGKVEAALDEATKAQLLLDGGKAPQWRDHTRWTLADAHLGNGQIQLAQDLLLACRKSQSTHVLLLAADRLGDIETLQGNNEDSRRWHLDALERAQSLLPLHQHDILVRLGALSVNQLSRRRPSNTASGLMRWGRDQGAQHWTHSGIGLSADGQAQRRPGFDGRGSRTHSNNRFPAVHRRSAGELCFAAP